jgi:predicted RND superfamily exporter protein
MERYVRFIVRHRVAVLIAVVLNTLLLASQLSHVRLEIRRRAVLPQDHPYVKIQNRISDLFGGEAVVVIGVTAQQGTIFAPPVLAKIDRVTQALLETKGVIDTSLFSIAAPYVKAIEIGTNGAMEVHPLMERVPETDAQMEKLRYLIRSDQLYYGNLVSHDESSAVIVVEFDDRVTDPAIAQRIEEVVAPERDGSVVIALAGAPILRAELARYTAFVGVLFPVAVVLIGLIHYEAFRTWQAMFLPLLTALLSVVWALGIMGALRQPMDTWSAITPVVILAVAAGHAVQLLKRYYEEYAVVRDSQRAVVLSVTAVGPVMLTAGLIASAGFASLMGFGVTSVRVFGLLMASGILSALIVEMTFTPAMRCMLPPPRERELKREGQVFWLDRLLGRLARIVVNRPRSLLIGTFGLVVAVAIGSVAIRVDNSFRYWFAPSTRVRQDDALLNAKLPGTASLRLLVEGSEANVLHEPEILRAISDLEVFMDADPQIGGLNSLAGHVKRMHQAMNGGAHEYYAIPDNKKLIGQYLFLYSAATGPDGLSAFVDATYQRAVIRGLSKTDGAGFSRDFLNRVQRYAETRFAGLPVTVGVAGGTLGVQTAMNEVVVKEKAINVAQVGVIIFVLSAVALRSLVAAVFVLTPLAVAVVVNLGVMGWSGIWLDMTTAAITAMGASIGADFAIYVVYRIREEAARAPLESAIKRSLQTSGKAVFFVSSAVAGGYLVLPFAGFSIWTRLGVLTALIVSVSALATLTLIPSLFLLVRPRFLGDRQEREPKKLVAGQGLHSAV